MDLSDQDFDHIIDLNDFVYKEQVIGLADLRFENHGYSKRKHVFFNTIFAIQQEALVKEMNYNIQCKFDNFKDVII